MTPADSSAEDRVEAQEGEKEAARRWRDANREKIAEQSRAYKAEHREELREKRREYYQKVVKPRERNRRKRYAAWRRRVQADPEYERQRARQNQLRYIERQMAADPEGYRQRRREQARAYWAKNREKLNAQKRERYLRDPERMRAASRAYLEKNREAVRQQRRGYYQANREKILAANRRWKQRERHRRANGLPPPRLHKASGTEKLHNRAAADAFFSRRRTAEELAHLRFGGPTPEQLIHAWHQESERARAVHRHHADKELQERLEKERQALRAKQAAEEARMDAIARVINDRLRTHPRTRQGPNAHESPLPPSTSPQPRSL
jgi:hypothetical protein